jgi:Tol biopolymer transport system component/predicted Ser/Thr protein kinase
MGIVYLAEQDAPLRRKVALKLVKRGMDSKEVLARFDTERQALALMEHPGIARVIDAGTAEDGRPYFVMEYVDGLPITEHCDRRELLTRERLELFAEVCDAAEHAHAKGIVHRDIKPSNVLVAEQEGRARPKIIDFGVAKATAQRLTEETAFTSLGVMIGTPGYMSPEQSDASEADVDARSDVYSLGILAYELLVGAPPFDPRHLRQAGWAEMLRIIREEEPQRPSARLSGLGDTATDVAKARQTSPLALSRELRGDLDWITLKALQKDRGRRYASAAELAADVRRHLHDEPVSAGPPGILYRMRKALRRHRVVVATAAATTAAAGIIALAVAGAGRTATSGRPGRSIQVEKLTNRGDVERAALSPDGRYLAFSTLDSGGGSVWLNNLAQKTEVRLAGPIDSEFAPELWFSRLGGSVYYSLRPRKGAISALYQVPAAGGDPQLVRVGIAAAGGGLGEIAPDERHFAFWRVEGQRESLVVADTEGGPETEIPGAPHFLDWSADSSRMLAITPGDAKKPPLSTLLVVGADGSGARKIADFPRWLTKGWWTPDGRHAVVSFVKGQDRMSTRDSDFELAHVDVATGALQPLGDRAWGPPGDLLWFPDGSGFLLTTWYDRGLWEVSYPEGRVTRVPPDTHSYSSPTLSTDGSKLAAVQRVEKSEILVSSTAAGGSLRRAVSGTDVDHSLCWTADGKIVFSSNEAGSHDLYVSDADGSNRRPLTSDRESNETEPAASPDGRYIVFVLERAGERMIARIDRDGTGLRILTPPTDRPSGNREPQVTADGRWVLYRAWARDPTGPTLAKVPIDGGTPVPIKGGRSASPPLDEWVLGASGSPDGQRLAYFTFSQSTVTWAWSSMDIVIASADGQVQARFPYAPARSPGFKETTQRIRWSRDGAAIFYPLLSGGTWNLWKQPIGGGPPAQVTFLEDSLHDFDWSFDGKTLACSRQSTLSDAVLITAFR